MRNTTIVLGIYLLVLAALIVGSVCLQIFLSKRESRWPGLVLPVINGLYSVLAVLNVMATGSVWETVGIMLVAFLMTNIPTAVLLAIYFSCREKVRKSKGLDKMNIQDL